MSAAELLRAARTRHGVSQRGLAIRAGTSQGYVSQLERGEVSPTVEALERLLAVLGEQLQVGCAASPAPDDVVASGVSEELEPGPMLAAFAARDVDLVLAGGLAARAHGLDVPVDAVEVSVATSPENLQRVTLCAAADLAGKMEGVRPGPDGSRGLPGGARVTFATVCGRLVLAPGTTAHLTLARRAAIFKVDGIAVPCAGRDDLVNRSRPGGIAPDPVLLAALVGGGAT